LALVFGGTGTIGSAVLRGLAQAGVPAAFTYFKNSEKAAALSAEHSQRAIRTDLSRPSGAREAFEALDAEGRVPDVLIYCAGANCAKSIGDTTAEDWAALQAVNLHGAFVASQELVKRLKPGAGADIVLMSALDRAQSLPLPVAFATTQGAISTMAMALAKELGPRGVRVNVLALGALDDGMSRGLGEKLLSDYKSFSALRRVGKAEEAVQAALWLALENTYMSGKVFAANGGI
jgi:3-oxoacyl-[acyl-carrier protein] reductase